MRTTMIHSLLSLGLALTTTGLSADAGTLVTAVSEARKMLIKQDLGDGIHVFTAPSELEYWTATNSVVVINDDEVVVFDSCTRAVTAQAVIAEIRELTNKPVTTLINSHWHQDHWSGNHQYTRAFPGIRIISTAQTREFMSHMGAQFFVRELGMFGLRLARDAFARAVETGKLDDGSVLTPEVRASKEAELALGAQFEAEVAALPRVLPNLVYQNEMTFWSGAREFRLMSLTGDATDSTVLYLPRDRLLATGDVLVSPEDGHGPPPWTTNSYAITPWVEALQRLEQLDVRLIVPGQGPVMPDKAYLRQTRELFAAIVDQVQAALKRGVVTLPGILEAVNVDEIGQQYTPGEPLKDAFHGLVRSLAKKAMLEATDGGADVN